MFGQWGTLTIVLAVVLVAGFGAALTWQVVAGSAVVALATVLAFHFSRRRAGRVETASDTRT